ncbi:MAG TPA: hypothetical protein VK988_15415 [Acidimicrobiales bacterium]|nr:hypothetical protein [Acidimicrobiales bacterium]
MVLDHAYEYPSKWEAIESIAEKPDIQRSLNGRLRKTLGYMTPSAAYAQVVAATT